MSDTVRLCKSCGEPLPPGEQMFQFHGYSGPCPKPPLPKSPETEHIMQFFSYGHLPDKLQIVSKPFCELAENIVAALPRNPERTVALRKLLEAKDAAVRAVVAK